MFLVYVSNRPCINPMYTSIITFNTWDPSQGISTIQITKWDHTICYGKIGSWLSCLHLSWFTFLATFLFHWNSQLMLGTVFIGSISKTQWMVSWWFMWWCFGLGKPPTNNSIFIKKKSWHGLGHHRLKINEPLAICWSCAIFQLWRGGPSGFFPIFPNTQQLHLRRAGRQLENFISKITPTKTVAQPDRYG